VGQWLLRFTARFNLLIYYCNLIGLFRENVRCEAGVRCLPPPGITRGVTSPLRIHFAVYREAIAYRVLESDGRKWYDEAIQHPVVLYCNGGQLQYLTTCQLRPGLDQLSIIDHPRSYTGSLGVAACVIGEEMPDRRSVGRQCAEGGWFHHQTQV
jgi:hypothetical protein